MAVEKIKVIVFFVTETDKSFKLEVNRIYDEEGNRVACGPEYWFPKSLCELEKIEDKKGGKCFLTAPEWLLIEKKVKY